MRRVLLPAVAALLVAAGYLGYARARVSDAIRTVAERAQLSVEYETTGSWRPGSVGIRGLTVSAPERAWAFEIASMDLSLEPVLGGPRRVQVTLPAQRVAFRWAGLQARAEVAGHADLLGLQGAGIRQLRAAVLVTSQGVFRSDSSVARGIALDLQLASVTHAPNLARLRGSLALRGQSAADALRVLGAATALEALFPDTLQAPFESSAFLAIDEQSLRLESIRARCRDLSVRGNLTWTGPAPDGALLLTRGARSVGLRIAGGEVHAELAPDADWLERSSTRLTGAELTSAAQ